MLYGLHWWLDAATDYNWSGLVLDDYRLVMALPRMRRYGFVPVIARPPFTQQIGPYGTVENGDLLALLQAIPNLPLVSLSTGAVLADVELPTGYHREKRTNFVLDLSRDFGQVVDNFSKRMRGYVRKYDGDRLESSDAGTVVDLYRRQIAAKAGLGDYHFERLGALIEASASKGRGELLQLREDGELLCAGFFPRFGDRIYNPAAASTELGYKRRGMTRLLVQLMSASTGSSRRFDFMGSDLPGVKEYFAGFGGVDEGYHVLQKQWFGRQASTK